MKDVYFATTNIGKVRSLERMLAPSGIRVLQANIELPEPQTTDLRVIATEKVLAAYKAVGQPVVAQDTGFFMEAWGGFPGPFVKFALETLDLSGFITLNNARMGACEFRECLAYHDPNSGTRFFESTIPGRLAETPRGHLPEDAWSKLLLVFIPEGCEKTVAEMNPLERAEWRKSRGDTSATKFAQWITTR